MTSINTNTDFSNYDKFMEAAKQGQEGLDKIYDYIDTLKLYLRDSRLNTSIKVDEINKLKAEIVELNKDLDIIHKEIWSCDGEYDGKVNESVWAIQEERQTHKELEEENDKLKEEMDELKAENTELMKEQYKLLDEKESLSTTFWTKNEELKEDIERLKGKATAWKIINAGTDWENIAQICDEEMARELVKTGEVNWMDFDFLIWPENEEE